MKKHTLLFSSLFLILLSSCERDANVDLPEVDPKQVLNCYISPGDTVVNVYLSSSQPITQPSGSSWQYLPVQGASVVLSKPGESISLPFNSQIGTYSAQVSSGFFVSGETYTLSSDHSEFKPVTATTTLPNSQTELTNIIRDEVEVSTFGSTEYRNRFRLDILDPDLQTFNYYRLGFYEINTDITNETFVSTLGFFATDDANMINGKIAVSELFYQNWSEPWDFEIYYEIVSMTVNEDYYRYHSTIDASSISGGGPFSEPVIVYTNVQNGLGCFGGYVKKTFLVPD